ncbi:MAG: helix-turn-helix domain-containing protein [Anaerotignum sp.]
MGVRQKIKECRQKQGLSVDELAAKLDKNRATIYRYENGAIENLPITVLEPLAKALNTTPAFLMGWTENGASLTEKPENMSTITDETIFSPTKHELKVLLAYRKQLAMQAAVDRILGITPQKKE